MGLGKWLVSIGAACLLAACSNVDKTAAPGSSSEAPATVPGVQISARAHAMLAADTDSQRDFRKIINSAKAKVFPAVVFIRCIQQDFANGDRATQQVGG